jgi:hypothetical protein
MSDSDSFPAPFLAIKKSTFSAEQNLVEEIKTKDADKRNIYHCWQDLTAPNLLDLFRYLSGGPSDL